MLISLADALAMAAQAPLLPVEQRAAAAACGMVLAEPVLAPHAVPERDLALIAGHAVQSAAIADASTALPLPLGAGFRLCPGDPLPHGCDAVLPEALCDDGSAVGPVAPGENVFRAGQGIARGALLMPAGARIGATASVALAAAGIGQVSVRPFRLFAWCDTTHAGPRAAWPGITWLDAPPLPGRCTARAVAIEHATATGLAITRHAGAEVAVLVLPADPFGCLAGVLALGIALLHRVSGHGAPALPRMRLAARVTSPPGLATVVLLRAADDLGHPLPWGSLAALAQATHATVVPAESEGYPQGALVPAEPLAI